MLVPLFMARKALLKEPMFYISAFFERNRDEYYERLLAVSRDGAWTEWIEFFLRAVIEQAKENQNKAASILALYKEMKTRVADLVRSQYTINALDFVFQRPVFRSTDFVKGSGIPKPTAMRISKLLRDKGILISLRIGMGRREGVLAFPALLNIAEGADAF
jgi:Fic family protein